MKQFKDHDLGILLLRLALGIVFVAHGWDKLQNIEGVIGFFGSLGLPSLIAYLVALVELAAGLAMLLGIYTYEAGWALAVVMAGAIYLVKISKGLIGGYELEMTLFLAAIAVSLLGSGRHTVHSWLAKNYK